MAKQSNKKLTRDTGKAPSKGGRPCTYTPEALYAKFEEYKEWVKDHPITRMSAYQGVPFGIPTDRPMTIVGFCVFADISTETFRGYGKRQEFFGVLARVRETIETDQLEGAMVNQFNSSIVARVLKLADRTEVVNKSEADRISEMTDEELQAKIDELSAI